MTDPAPDAATERRRLLAVVGVLVALLAIGLPLALFVVADGTDARVADRADIGTNRLGAATLDLEVGDVETTLGATDLAPGDVVVGQVQLINAGSLPLHYSGRMLTDDGTLARFLQFDVWVTTSGCELEPVDAAAQLAMNLQLATDDALLFGDPASGRQEGDRRLAPGATELLCVRARLPLTAGNAAQNTQLDVRLVFDAEHDIEAS